MAAPAAPFPPMPLEEGDLEAEEAPLEEELAGEPEELDPMFAADASMAFPELDDEQLTALQRAIRSLM